jgi:MFS family permease
VANVIDRSQILAASLQSIKREFGASDFQLGMLTGLPFALFYSTMGIPIASWADRWNRRNVLALAVAAWSGMTALCGLSVNFGMLFGARIGTAIGEAGGSPPSHSLISDYFPKLRRGTAFSIFALAVPIGTSLGAAIGGWGNQHLGWRYTFMLVGFPGLLLAPRAAPSSSRRAAIQTRCRKRPPPRPRACWRSCASSGRVSRSAT